MAYGSGNLAQVYFDLYPRRITLDELETAFPGMIDALVAHEGIGVVAGYLDADTAVVLGKGGRRNLHTGEVTGVDPLLPYGDVSLRAWQVGRVMDFPHAGDLMVISTVYPDGTVAALEELIGNHGGMGGEQTDAFCSIPATWSCPKLGTRSTCSAFSTRGAGCRSRRRRRWSRRRSGWAPGNLLKGVFHQPSRWVGRALRALVLDRSAYSEVAEDSYMTAGATDHARGAGGGDDLLFEWMESVGLPGPPRGVARRPGGAGGRGASVGRQGGVYQDSAAVGFGVTARFLSLLAFFPLLQADGTSSPSS